MAFTCQPQPRASAFAGVSVPPMGAPAGFCAEAASLTCSLRRRQDDGEHRRSTDRECKTSLTHLCHLSAPARLRRPARSDERCRFRIIWRSIIARNAANVPFRASSRARSSVMRMFTVVSGVMLFLAAGGISSAQTPPPQAAPPAPPRTPLLPTPPVTAPPTPDQRRQLRDRPAVHAGARAHGEGRRPRRGTVHEFTMDSKDSKIYPGIAKNQTRRRPLHAPGRRLCPRAVRRRHAGAVHRRAGRHVSDIPQQSAADARQPDPREARARRWSR